MEDSLTNQKRKLVTLKGAVIDLVLATLFFLLLTFVVIPQHVPAESATTVLIFSALTSFCIAAVFWIALNLFRVTLVDQLLRKQGR